MKFYARKRRQAPAVIIISLIDILIVLLIFLMVTTTFRQQPAMKIALPEAQQSKAGAVDNVLVVTIPKQDTNFYLENRMVSTDQLKLELQTRIAANSNLNLSIQADTDASFGQVVKIMDIAKAINIRSVNAFIRSSGK